MLPMPYMGSCQNDGPFLGTLNNRCRIIFFKDTKRDPNFDNHPHPNLAKPYPQPDTRNHWWYPEKISKPQDNPKGRGETLSEDPFEPNPLNPQPSKSNESCPKMQASARCSASIVGAGSEGGT